MTQEHKSANIHNQTRSAESPVMSDIQAIIRSVANANDRGQSFVREVRKMSETEKEKIIEAVKDLRGVITEISKTTGKIKNAASPKSPHAMAERIAKAARESAKLEQEIGGYEKIAVPASSIESVKGHEFCVTGQVEGMEREELQELIKSHRGVVRNALTKGVDVLVIGSAPGPKKVSEARKRGIRIVQAHDLIKWIEKG